MKSTVLSSRNVMPTRVLHTMLRVGDLERSIAFYTEKLGMQLLRKERYPSGSYTLAFLGYGDEHSGAVIELTHNWGKDSYVHGTAFGHVALAVTDIHAICAQLMAAGVKVLRAPGPMTASSPDRTDSEVIAFIEDPDGYRIELIGTP
jgi:lactoylglutathione lyase